MSAKKSAKLTEHRIGLYIRVSTEEQASNPEGSIKSQEQRLRSHIQFRNAEGVFGEVAAVFIDRARSGKDTNRPELQRMLKAIREKQITMVMVTELSRLSRSIKDFCDIWQMMKGEACQFQSLREQFDTTSAAGEMVLYTIANIAQFERRQTAERTAANFQARAERGLYNGGSIPFGYERHPENKGYLVVNRDDAAIVREAFATFLKEGSIAAAGKSLNDSGYRMKMARDGGGLRARLGHFTADNLYGVLTNRAYVGLRSFEVKGEERTSKAVWEAIIDEDTFNKTQVLLKKNYRRLKTAMNKRYPFILSGITFCASCGDRMPGKSAHGNGGKYPYYEHGWATKRQAYLSKKVFACDPHRVSATTFEKLVWNEIEKLFHHQDFAAAIISHAHEMHKKQGNLLEVEKFRGKVKALEDQVEALAEHLLKIPKTLSPLPVYRQMERVAQVKEQAERELQRLEAETYVRDVPIALKDYKSYVANLRDLLSNAEKHDLSAKIVAKLIYKVEIKPKGFRLHYFVGKRELSRDDQNSMKAAKPPIVLSPENKKGVELTSAPFLKPTGSNTLDSGRGDATLVEPTISAWGIPVQWSIDKVTAKEIKELYLGRRMTTRAISAALGVSKTTVIERLHSIGIKRATNSLAT